MWDAPIICPPKRTCRNDLNSLRARQPRVAITCVALLLLISTGLLTTTSTGTITGTVKTEAGAAIAHAKVIARAPAGQEVAFAFTDEHGRFQFAAIHAGIYTVEIEFGGPMESSGKTANVKNGETLELNFVAHTAKAGTSRKPELLGPVSFYNQPNFRQGELQNPSGGGGYSNAASAQAVKMLNQYLAAPKPPASASTGTTKGEPGISARPHESELEQSGSTLLARKDYTQATEVFEKATALYPRSERLQMGLGLSLYGAGKYPAAVNALTEAARLAPDDSAPVVMLAEALRFAPDAGAASVVKQFSDLHPQSAQGHYALGLSLWNDFRADHDSSTLANAQAEFEKAIALDPTDAASHLQLGMIYDEQKAPELAAHEYLAAISLNHQLATAHYRLAQDYERLGEKDKAAAELAQYEKLRGQTAP
jgi:tetratricopeptide (TPR) repeat protein